MRPSLLLLTLCAAASIVLAATNTLSSSSMPKDKPSAQKPSSTPATAAQVAIIQTTKGTMTLQLWPDVAPRTVENFKKLADKGFYNGTAFHRIVKGFMIQGGDPLTKDIKNADMFGTGGPGYTVKAEFNDRRHVRGVISMARSSHPDSAGSQFFICLADASFLDRQYTAFGQLTQGEDVLLAIGNTPTQVGNSGEKSEPLERIEVISITIAPASTEKDPHQPII